MRAGAHAPARTLTGPPRPPSRCAHAGAPHPDDVSCLFASGRPVFELPAEELADLVRGLDRLSSAPDGKLLEVGLAASEDEADGVVEGGQLDGAEVAGHIVAWSDLRTALRDLGAGLALSGEPAPKPALGPELGSAPQPHRLSVRARVRKGVRAHRLSVHELRSAFHRSSHERALRGAAYRCSLYSHQRASTRSS